MNAFMKKTCKNMFMQFRCVEVLRCIEVLSCGLDPRPTACDSCVASNVAQEPERQARILGIAAL